MRKIIEDATIVTGEENNAREQGYIDAERRSTMRGKAFILFIAIVLQFLSASLLQAAPAAKVVRATLKNGLRVVIIQDVLAPVVTTQVNYLVGANEAPPGFPGMAHAQEHMMFRGSPGLSGDQLSGIIAALGGEFNADTQQSVTQYFFTVPAADLDVALRVEAVRMGGVLDSESLWERERGAIDQEVAQDLSNPEYVFYTKLLDGMFKDTPYAHDALGTRESFAKTSGKMLKKFYDEWYGPNNAILVIAGNVDPVKTLKAVKKLFEGLASRLTPDRPVVRLQPLKASEVSLETDLPYALAVISYRLPGYDNPDYAAGQILADVLASRRGNLYALVPQGKAMSTDFDVSAYPKAALGYITASFPKGGDGALLVSTIKGIVADYVKKGFPSDLVEAAKRLETADNEFAKNSVDGLASLWSQALAVEGRNSPQDDIDAIKKVTVDDVNRVAREYLDNKTAITALLEPRPSGEAVPSRPSRGKESFAPKQVGHVKLPAWAEKAALLPVVPPSTVKPAVMVLRNGVRLIVQHESVSSTVSVYGKIKSTPALQVPESKEGVDEVLGDLFSYGTKTLDRLAFQKALDDIAARESAGRSFSLQVLSGHFDRGMQLLADNVLNPALPEEAFKVVQQETMGALSGLLKSPSYLSRRALMSALYPKDDPTLRQATPETVKKLTLEDVKNYYRKVFRPDMTTIVVIGEVTPDQAKIVMEKYFGGWKAEGPRPQTDLPSVPPNKPSSAIVPDTSRVQDEVTLAATLGVTRSNPDYYTLQVGRHILSGAFYATRLYRDLRERTGLVYTVETLLDVGKTRSIFGVFYACDPQNVAKAREIAVRDLRDMQTKRATADELRQAKTILLRQIPLSGASVDGVAERLLYYSLEGLPLDEQLRAARHYRAVTASQVKKAFAKWIRTSDFVQITTGPTPQGGAE
jgi:zinc protease